MTTRPVVVIAGGGTAGHVLPAVAIANELVARGVDPASVTFVGGRHGLEKQLVPAAGFSLRSVPGRGLPTSMSWRAVPRLGALAVGIGVCVAAMLRRRPKVVVSVGGYAAVPCGMAAALLRIPLVVVEPNAVPGRANLLMARFARVCATGSAGTGLPREVVTGVPVRREILAVDVVRDRPAARAELAIPADADMVAVVGGSLGAGPINDAVAAMVRGVVPPRPTVVYHVTGDRDFARISALGGPETGFIWHRVRYEQRIDRLLAAADVVVGRAGASFVAELAALGIPAVLVPLPGAPGDHQTHNARAAAAATGGVVLVQAELDADSLWARISELLASRDSRPAQSHAAGGKSAAGAVVDLLADVVPGGIRSASASPSAS